MPADQLDMLQIQPGVHAIIQNQVIESADHDLYAWEGWATDRRTLSHVYDFDGPILTPLLGLPDGGVFAVNIDGDMMILNEDGTIRNEADLNKYLPGIGRFKNPAVLSSSNIIYTVNSTNLYAIDAPTGEIIWALESPRRFKGGMGLTDSMLVIAAAKEEIYGIDPQNGDLQWTHFIDDEIGLFLAPPTIGPDGQAAVINKNGILTVLNPQTGQETFSFTADAGGTPYDQAPQFDQAGNIYFLGNNGFIYRINPDGKEHYRFEMTDTFMAQAVVTDDGTLFVGGYNGRLIGLDSGGTPIFDQQVPENGHIESPLALSADQSKLYVTMKEKSFLAYDIASQSLLWTHYTTGNLKAGPVVAPNGNLHLGDRSGIYEIIDDATGLVVYRYTGFDEFVISPILSPGGSAFFHDKDTQELIVLSRIPIGWSETIPHVEPTEDPLIYKVANPLSIDIGADIAHENGVTGTGIGIAVIDSGVYFDNNTIATLGAEVQNHFLGQAEFVGAANCADTSPFFSDCFSD